MSPASYRSKKEDRQTQMQLIRPNRNHFLSPEQNKETFLSIYSDASKKETGINWGAVCLNDVPFVKVAALSALLSSCGGACVQLI